MILHVFCTIPFYFYLPTYSYIYLSYSTALLCYPILSIFYSYISAFFQFLSIYSYIPYCFLVSTWLLLFYSISVFPTYLPIPFHGFRYPILSILSLFLRVFLHFRVSIPFPLLSYSFYISTCVLSYSIVSVSIFLHIPISIYAILFFLSSISIVFPTISAFFLFCTIFPPSSTSFLHIPIFRIFSLFLHGFCYSYIPTFFHFNLPFPSSSISIFLHTFPFNATLFYDILFRISTLLSRFLLVFYIFLYLPILFS